MSGINNDSPNHPEPFQVGSEGFVCKLCRCADIKKKFDLKESNGESFSAVTCNECGLFQVAVNWQDAPAIAPTTDYDDPGENWIGTAETAAHINKGKYFADILNATFTLERANVLDIGCGQGHFLNECQKLGAGKVCGQEFRHTDLKTAKQQDGVEDVRSKSFADTDTWPDAEFDVICSLDVVEHVHDLHEFFESHLRLLKPGGILMHATPGYDCITHWVGRKLTRINPNIARTLCNVQQVTSFSGGPHTHIMGYRQLNWLSANFSLEIVDKKYVKSFTYSDAHYARMLPVIRLLPAPIGKLIFGVIRRVIRNKLVFILRKVT